MITITKTILGFSALASAGAWTVVDPVAPAKMHAPAPAIVAHGKMVDRMPMVDSKLSGEQILIRIRGAHGLPTGEKIASVDCKLFAWPNIPAECISTADAPRKVRVISIEVRTTAPAAATAAAQPTPARVIR
jgi:hypothetical protein